MRFTGSRNNRSARAARFRLPADPVGVGIVVLVLFAIDFVVSRAGLMAGAVTVALGNFGGAVPVASRTEKGQADEQDAVAAETDEAEEARARRLHGCLP